ncbi:ankyrin [Penicillium lividum]|nr:ankyrin [Penicillium lividum]
MLLSAGAHAGSVRKTPAGLTPLHSAILNKQAELVRLLVNRKMLIRTHFVQEMAAQANEEYLVEILLTDKRVNPDLTVHPMGRTPLLEAT